MELNYKNAVIAEETGEQESYTVKETSARFNLARNIYTDPFTGAKQIGVNADLELAEIKTERTELHKLKLPMSDFRQLMSNPITMRFVLLDEQMNLQYAYSN